MLKLLVVQSSAIVQGVFKKLLDEENFFDYIIVGTYAESEEALAKGS